MDRGILSTATPSRLAIHEQSLLDVIKNFTRTSGSSAHADTAVDEAGPGTNFATSLIRTVRGRVVVISAIDNLIKGASGAAVQKF
jgi:N-acetyl-gamma-glutamyl-phosphate reductase